MSKRYSTLFAGTFAAVALVAESASAGWVDLSTYIAAGSGRAAAAQFQRGDGVGGDLTDFLRVTLTNTGALDASAPTDVLTALFFDLTNNGSVSSLSLARQAAWIITPHSITYGGTTDPGGVVGGEWAYKGGISAHGASRGIGSAGYGLFGPGDLFPGNDLDPPTSPNGLNYGVTTAFDNPGNDNGGLQVPTIKSEVNFRLSGLDQFGTIGFDNVGFQYGTALDEPYLPGTPDVPEVPEPATLYSLSAGLALCGLLAARRRRRSQPGETA